MKSENDSFNYFDVYRAKYRNDDRNSRLFPGEKKLLPNKPKDNSLPHFSSCLIDHSGRQFACIHEHCHEFNCCFKNDILTEKLDFHALNFHPGDKNLWCEEAFPDILRFINSIPLSDLPDYRFSFNHRYIRKDGSISQFLHEGSLTFSGDKSLPVLDLKVFSEIGDIKTDETIILSIFRYSSLIGYQKVFSKVYGKNCNSQLSQREMEIIILCLQGLTSKMIADKLHLSIHTVKNHKRNCMEKTLTHNIAELIHLCILNHWL